MKKRRIGAKVWAAAALGLGGGLLAAACGSDECDGDWVSCDETSYCPIGGRCVERPTGENARDFADRPRIVYFGDLESHFGGPERQRPCEDYDMVTAGFYFLKAKAGASCPSCQCEPISCVEDARFDVYDEPRCSPPSAGSSEEFTPPPADGCIRIEYGNGMSPANGASPVWIPGNGSVDVLRERDACSAKADHEETLAAFEEFAVVCDHAYDVDDPENSCEKRGMFCVKPAPAGYLRCVQYGGGKPPEDVTCPSPYVVKRVIYKGFEGCAPCGCEATGSRECELSVSLYEDDACTARIPTGNATVSPECIDLPPKTHVGGARVNLVREKLVTCSPTGGEQIGELAPSDPVTLCCNPDG